MSNLIDILSNSNKDIDNQKLMDYLSGKLAGNEQHEMEKWLIDNDFAGDAWEGLKELSTKKDLATYVDELNRQLAAYTAQKKKKRDRNRGNQPGWIYFTVAIILLVIVLTWIVIRMLNH